MPSGSPRSEIWSMPRTEFEKLVAKNSTISGIVRDLGGTVGGGMHQTVKARIKVDAIKFDHIALGKDSNRGKKFCFQTVPLDQVMKEGSTYSRGSLKRRLIKQGLLEEKCNCCGQLPIWQGKKLVLVLDHKNGIYNDHRLKNLRLLCPNCNSQQDTFAGRNSKKH